ncbi:hypothetical protein D3C72_742340 [compost metagenome]
MVLVIAVLGRINVRRRFAQHDGAVVDLLALRRSTHINNTGDQAAVFGAHQVIHHGQEAVLAGFVIRNGRLRPDDDRRFAHIRTRFVQIGLQGADQRFRIPLHRLSDIALHHRDVDRLVRLRGKPVQLAQRPRQQQQCDGNPCRGDPALIDGVHQQPGDRHQHKGDGIYPEQRRHAFQRAVNLAVAKLQPGETGQHPAT